MINPRQERILAAIVKEYVKSAQPVASRTLVEKYDFAVSPATIRNDMVTLEEAGLLRQPHTSAGRIPSEEGYRYYLDRFVHGKKPPIVKVKLTITPVAPKDPKHFLRQITKALTKVSGETSFVSTESGWHYYTGVSRLFDKPEFNDVESMRSISRIVDQFDEVIQDLAPRLDEKVNVWIGEKNPFGAPLATMMLKFEAPLHKGVLGIVGPQRMDYAKNIKLLRDARQALSRNV